MSGSDLLPRRGLIAATARRLFASSLLLRLHYRAVEDAVQEGFLGALLRLPEWQGGCTLEAHLVRSVRRHLFRQAGHYRACPPVVPEYRHLLPEPAADGGLQAALARLDLAEALRVITPAERGVLDLHYGLSGGPALGFAGVGEALGCTELAARSRHFDALRRLRTHFRVEASGQKRAG